MLMLLFTQLVTAYPCKRTTGVINVWGPPGPNLPVSWAPTGPLIPSFANEADPVSASGRRTSRPFHTMLLKHPTDKLLSIYRNKIIL